MLSSSTGCVYWSARGSDLGLAAPDRPGRGKAAKAPAKEADAEEGADESAPEPSGVVLGRKYDPTTNEITECKGVRDVRACTRETADGLIYGVSGRNANLWVFDVKTETTKDLGPGAVATQQYVTTMDIDPTGRYVYYAAGAHGGGVKDGTPIVQFDTKLNKRKVIAFLNEFYTQKYGYAPDGTFGSALSPEGDVLFVTWNGKRLVTEKDWDTCAMTAIHIPAEERQP
jgi:hypothetical protein